MPFVNPFAFGTPKVTVPAKKGVNSGAANPSPTTNPRNPAPVQPTFAATDSQLVNNDQKSLSATVLTQGTTTLLPMQAITELDLDVTLTITGTVSSSTIDVAASIDHIDFYDGDSGQQISTLPGGVYLYDHLVRFYPVKGAYVSATSAPANLVGTSATSAEAVLRIPFQIPAPHTSPSKMIIFWGTIATAAGSATSVAVSCDITANFGSAPNGWMIVRDQVISLASGNNYINQLAIPSNVPIAELFFRTGTLSSFNWFQINTGSTIVLPYQKEKVVAGRNTRDFGSALQSTTLALDLGTLFSIGPSSQLLINTGGAISNEHLTWVYFSG